MIEVSVRQDGIKMSGHANYAVEGKDIVCAGATALVQTLVTSIENLTKDNQRLDIRETQRVEYTLMNVLSDEWLSASGQNCPMLGGEATFSFGDAIKYLKRGLKVARKGWNGKKQYIQLATGISYKNASGDIINCEHEAIGNMAIAFVGTSGVQMGWLASQADMLAEDWVFAD